MINYLKNILKKTFNNMLRFIFTISIIFSFLYKASLLPVSYNVYLLSISELFYNVSLSIIAGSIIYFIVDYFPNKKRKREFLDLINVNIQNINSSWNDLMRLFNNDLNGPSGELLKIEDGIIVDALQSNIWNRNTGLNINGVGNAPFNNVVYMHCNSIRSSLEEIKKQKEYITPSIYRQVLIVENINLISNLNILEKMILSKSITLPRNYGIISEQFIQYYRSIIDLNNIWNEYKRSI